MGGTSKENEAEAHKVIDIVSNLLRAHSGVKPSEIGVVTPYAAQCRRLRKELGQLSVETSSVDGFQGREKEVIVFSTVRASERGGLGFVSDWRRMNVALTRAKRGLIVVGHAQTLARDGDAWAP